MKNLTRSATIVACMMIYAVFISSCVNIDRESSSVLRLTAGTGQHTKLSGATDGAESMLNTVSFYVFDESGNLEASTVWNKETGASCEVRNGKKKIYAIVNCSLDVPPPSEDDLLSTISCIYDNSPDNLVMSGWSEEKIDDDKRIHILVRRLVGKVEVNEIKVALKEGSRTGISLNGLYLTNVNSSISFDGTKEALPSDWINKAGYTRSEADKLTYEECGTFIPDGSSHSVCHTFYACPNGTTVDSHSTEEFCARFTRLVLDTDAGYYRLDIPGILGNNSYVFKSVTITGEGGADPEAEETAANCAFELEVADWEDGGTRTERI